MNAIDQQKKINFYLQKIESIPSLPNIVLELIKIIDNPMSSTRQIENLIEKDQGMTLKILKLANSAYYSIPGGAKTLNRALTFLGYNTIKQIVISSSIFDVFKKLDSQSFNLTEYWKHSAAVAIASETLARQIKISGPEEVFVCGLVHDIGKLALLMIDKEDFLKTCVLAREKKFTFVEAEINRDSPRHAYWGQVLAKKWQLPTLLQSAIKDHHTSNHKQRLSTDSNINQKVDIVHLANQITHCLNFGNSGYDVQPPYDTELALRLELKTTDPQDLLKKIEEALVHAEPTLKLFTD